MRLKHDYPLNKRLSYKSNFAELKSSLKFSLRFEYFVRYLLPTTGFIFIACLPLMRLVFK